MKYGIARLIYPLAFQETFFIKFALSLLLFLAEKKYSFSEMNDSLNIISTLCAPHSTNHFKSLLQLLERSNYLLQYGHISCNLITGWKKYCSSSLTVIYPKSALDWIRKNLPNKDFRTKIYLMELEKTRFSCNPKRFMYKDSINFSQFSKICLFVFDLKIFEDLDCTSETWFPLWVFTNPGLTQIKIFIFNGWPFFVEKMPKNLLHIIVIYFLD